MVDVCAKMRGILGHTTSRLLRTALWKSGQCRQLSSASGEMASNGIPCVTVHNKICFNCFTTKTIAEVVFTSTYWHETIWNVYLFSQRRTPFLFVCPRHLNWPITMCLLSNSLHTFCGSCELVGLWFVLLCAPDELMSTIWGSVLVVPTSGKSPGI